MIRRQLAIRRRLVVAGALLALASTARPVAAQERGAAALAEAVEGLGVTTRVLMIGAHPDDEDTNLIAFLSRGRHVETAYLSLTRGDGGQNLIGDELGEALGVIRTEELLAARRVDGGRQYFTRAYDFGFSKSAEETYTHWPRDTILGDVVRVVREFRPHVIVAVFSGTPRDGHGHHQVSGLLAREAYDVAADTRRFPVPDYGEPWEPLKFYRARRGNAEGASVRMNAGEYDPVLGRSYAEIAAESRSQHKSQGFGALERKGPLFTHVLREASRVNAPGDPVVEQSMFDGIDTTLARFRPAMCSDVARAQLDSLQDALVATRAALDWHDVEAAADPADRVRVLAEALASGKACEVRGASRPFRGTQAAMDAQRSFRLMAERAQRALELASGVAMEATAVRELVAEGNSLPYELRLYNRGRDTLAALSGAIQSANGSQSDLALATIAPDSVFALEAGFSSVSQAISRGREASWPTQPYWLSRPRVGDFFSVLPRGDETRMPISAGEELVAFWYGNPPRKEEGSKARPGARRGVPIEYRYADPVRGDVSRPVAIAPAISVTLDRPLEMLPANTDVERRIRVRLRSADTESRIVTVHLSLPSGLTADSLSRTVTLPGYDAQATVSFTVRGRMAPGRDTIRVRAQLDRQYFTSGYQLVDYPHIRPRRLYRPAELVVQAVDVRVPQGLRIAYVPGVSDVVAPALRELGLDVTVIEPAALASADLSRFTTVVVGPRAYEAHPDVMANRARLLDFARRGGTLVVQYQQYAVQEPGVVPYPMTVARPHDRVTIEEAPVTFVDPQSPLLRGPNPISQADFAGWVQERSLYMPRTFDERYRAPLEMHDPGEPEQRGALLVAPLGEGTYVYTAISFFRQLPAGVPGAARLFVNLLAAGQGAGAP